MGLKCFWIGLSCGLPRCVNFDRTQSLLLRKTQSLPIPSLIARDQCAELKTETAFNARSPNTRNQVHDAPTTNGSFSLLRHRQNQSQIWRKGQASNDVLYSALPLVLGAAFCTLGSYRALAAS